MTDLNAGRFDGERTPAEMEEEIARKAVWREFGIDLPPRRDDREAPPVDEEALRRWVRGELTENEMNQLATYCLFYKSWCEASMRVKLSESLRKEAETN